MGFSTHGVKVSEVPLKAEFIFTAAKIIWDTVYATLATPAVCPSKLHQPMTQDQIAACSGETTFLVTKYIPPAVGYADTSSATGKVSGCNGDNF